MATYEEILALLGEEKGKKKDEGTDPHFWRIQSALVEAEAKSQSLLGAFGRAAAHGAAGMVASVPAFAGMVAEALGAEGAAESLKGAARAVEEAVGERVAPPPQVGIIEAARSGSPRALAVALASALGGAVGSSAVPLGTGALAAGAARLAGLGTRAAALAGTAAPSVAAETVETAQRLEEATGSRHPELAFPVGLVSGLLDTVLPGRILRRIGVVPALSKRLRSQIRHSILSFSLRSGATEMTTEALQQALKEGAAAALGDDFKAEAVAEAAMQGLVGGIGLGAVGGLSERGARAEVREAVVFLDPEKGVPEGAMPVTRPEKIENLIPSKRKHPFVVTDWEVALPEPRFLRPYLDEVKGPGKPLLEEALREKSARKAAKALEEGLVIPAELDEKMRSGEANLWVVLKPEVVPLGGESRFVRILRPLRLEDGTVQLQTEDVVPDPKVERVLATSYFGNVGVRVVGHGIKGGEESLGISSLMEYAHRNPNEVEIILYERWLPHPAILRMARVLHKLPDELAEAIDRDDAEKAAEILERMPEAEWQRVADIIGHKSAPLLAWAGAKEIDSIRLPGLPEEVVPRLAADVYFGPRKEDFRGHWAVELAGGELTIVSPREVRVEVPEEGRGKLPVKVYPTMFPVQLKLRKGVGGIYGNDLTLIEFARHARDSLARHLKEMESFQIHFVDRQTIETTTGGTRAAGLTETSTNKILIALPEKPEEIPQTYIAILHELGHAFTNIVVSRSQTLRAKLYGAYVRWVFGLRDVDINTAFRALFGRKSVKNLERPQDFAKAFGLIVNWYGFHEWLANNFTQLAVRGEIPGLELPEDVKKQLEGLVGFYKDLLPQKEADAAFKEIFSRLSLIRSDIPSIQPDSGVQMLAQVWGSPKIARRARRWSAFIEYGWNIQQIARRYPELQGLQDFLSYLRLWQREKTRVAIEADEVIKKWRSLPKKDAQRVSEWVLERTLALTPEQEEELKAEFETFTPEQQEVIRGIRKALDGILNELEGALIDGIQAQGLDPAAQIEEIHREFANMRNSWYFPLKRFGRFTVEVRDKDGRLAYFTLEETERAAHEAAEKLLAFFPEHQIRVGKLREDTHAFLGLSPTMFKRIAEKLDLSDEQKRHLEKILAAQFPSQSMRNHFLRRKYVPGFTMDSMRAFASYMLHAANYVARVKYADKMREAMSSVAAQSASLKGDVIAYDAVYNWLQKLFEYVMSPPEEWHNLRSFAFLWHLGFNIKSALVNLTQVPLVAYPYLAALWGDGKAVSSLMRAYRRVAMFYRRGTGISAEEKKVLEYLTEQGILDQTFTAELAGAAQGGLAEKLAGPAAKRAFRTLVETAGFVFHASEQINRRVTALAAAELALKHGLPEKLRRELYNRYAVLIEEMQKASMGPREVEATLATLEALDVTMFDYSAYNRARFMRGRKSAFFIFWSFIQNMLWFERYAPGRGRHLLLLLSLAGLTGLPFAEDADDLIEALSRYLGKRFRPSEEIAKVLNELEVDPDLVLYGAASRGMGLSFLGSLIGVPLPTIDLSASLSMGNILPGTEAKSFESFARELSGAGLGLVFLAWQALTWEDPDQWKRIELVLPTGIKNVSRMIRVLERGVETGMGGVDIVSFDPDDPYAVADAVGMALGFTPARLSRAYRAISLEKEVEAYWRERRGALISAFYWAHRWKGAKQDVLADIAEFNRKAPHPSLRITWRELRAAVKRREAGRIRLTRLGTRYLRYAPVAMENPFLQGEGG